jgi:hypothetical protein
MVQEQMANNVKITRKVGSFTYEWKSALVNNADIVSAGEGFTGLEAAAGLY